MSKQTKTFEENLAELEGIVTKLERGDVALEEALAEFQKEWSYRKTYKRHLLKLKRPWSRSCRQMAVKRR